MVVARKSARYNVIKNGTFQGKVKIESKTTEICSARTVVDINQKTMPTLPYPTILK